MSSPHNLNSSTSPEDVAGVSFEATQVEMQQCPTGTTPGYNEARKQSASLAVRVKTSDLYHQTFVAGMTEQEARAQFRDMMIAIAATRQGGDEIPGKGKQNARSNNLLDEAALQYERTFGLAELLTREGAEKGASYNSQADLGVVTAGDNSVTASSTAPTATDTQTVSTITSLTQGTLYTDPALAQYVGVCARVTRNAIREMRERLEYGNQVVDPDGAVDILRRHWKQENERRARKRKELLNKFKKNSDPGNVTAGDNAVTASSAPVPGVDATAQTQVPTLEEQQALDAVHEGIDTKDLGELPQELIIMARHLSDGNHYEDLVKVRGTVGALRDSLHDAVAQQGSAVTQMIGTATNTSDSLRTIQKYDPKNWKGPIAGGSRARRRGAQVSRNVDDWVAGGEVNTKPPENDQEKEKGLSQWGAFTRWCAEMYYGNYSTSWQSYPHPSGKGEMFAVPFYYKAFVNAGPNDEPRVNMRKNIDSKLSLLLTQGNIPPLKYQDESVRGGENYKVVGLEMAFGAKRLAIQNGIPIKAEINGHEVTFMPDKSLNLQERETIDALLTEFENAPDKNGKPRGMPYFNKKYEKRFAGLTKEEREARGITDDMSFREGMMMENIMAGVDGYNIQCDKEVSVTHRTLEAAHKNGNFCCFTSDPSGEPATKHLKNGVQIIDRTKKGGSLMLSEQQKQDYAERAVAAHDAYSNKASPSVPVSSQMRMTPKN